MLGNHRPRKPAPTGQRHVPRSLWTSDPGSTGCVLVLSRGCRGILDAMSVIPGGQRPLAEVLAAPERSHRRVDIVQDGHIVATLLSAQYLDGQAIPVNPCGMGATVTEVIQ